MHQTVPVSVQIFKKLFPFAVKDKDPASWQDHVKRNLVIEIRLEVQLFYGNDPKDNTAESRFPGFDYTSIYHRMRLRRHAHHRRLFRVMDELRLTPAEIYTLCDWEGTLIVRHRYEQQNKVQLRDTTGDDILVRMERDRLRAEEKARLLQLTHAARVEEEAQKAASEARSQEVHDTTQLIIDDMSDDDIDDDDDIDAMDERDDRETDDEAENPAIPEAEECPYPALRMEVFTGAVRSMPPEQYLQTRRLMSANPRVSRNATPTTSVAA